MAILKSSAENLTLNADGSGNDILFQSNGSQVGSLTAEGVLTATSFAGSGASLTALPAANITGTLPAISGVNLTALNASNLGSGTVPTARLGSGTASSSTFLRGDSTYAAVTSVGGATGADFNDDVKLRFGTGNDLEIYHNGSQSFIKDTGTGQLAILTSDFQVLNPADSEYMIRGVEDGDVKLYHNGIWKLQTSTAGINLAGGLDLTDGDIVFSTAGKGICLGVTSNTDANTLDDYEEGTWTPTLPNGGSISVSGSYYIKIGRFVTYYCYVTLSGMPNDSAIFKFGGLPFTVTTGNYHSGGAIGYVTTFNWINTGNQGTPSTQGGAATFDFPRHDGTAIAVLNSAVQGATYMIITGSYLAAS